MILTHINHKMPIYKDGTLFELLAVSISVLLLGGFSLSVLTRLLFGYGLFVGIALILLSFGAYFLYFPGSIAKIKIRQTLWLLLSFIFKTSRERGHLPIIFGNRPGWCVKAAGQSEPSGGIMLNLNAWKKEDRDTALIRTLRGGMILLFLLCLVLAAGWMTAPKHLCIYIPPDISNGATLKVNEIPNPLIYSFAYELWQEINYWPEEGEQNYGKNIKSYAAYLTPGISTHFVAGIGRT